MHLSIHLLRSDMTPDEVLSNANQSSGIWESEVGKHQVLSSDVTKCNMLTPS